jgi:cell wall-associated NlpC family hydrolase
MPPDETCVVTQPVANMYKSASGQAEVVSQAIYGSSIGLLEAKDGWAKVRTADGYTGWMPAASFRPLRAGERPYASQGRVAQVTSLFANLYQEPDVTKHAPALTVPFETRLEVSSGAASEGGRWLRIRLADGRAAWIQRGDIAIDPQPMPVPALVEFSKRFIGLPYLWGGTSTFGYDCSGFVQMLMRRRGVLVPRDAQPQADWSGAVAVDRNNLQPGDLVYFGEPAQKITHTGMYIGDGQFISATTHEKPTVQISNLEDVYWSRLFVAARRLK